jgi:2-polyprenyl-6-methoxyphenol hydroxylase-like FAD-dependent oxidoreductase
MAPPSIRVLCSGAGIAGSTLAHLLGKAGIKVTVLERAASLLPHGQNVDIQDSALQVCKAMGIMPQIRAAFTTEEGTRLIEPSGRPYASFPLVKGGASASGTSEFEILRGDLAKILYESARPYPSVDYKFGTTVKQILSNDASGVKVELSDGMVATYDVLVAADGQWSKVRKQAFPDGVLSVNDTRAYAIYWSVPRLPHDDGWWNICHALNSRILSCRPDPHGGIRVCLTCMPLTAQQTAEWETASRSSREVQQALVRKEFADAGWQMERFLDAMPAAPDFYFQAMKQIKLSKWSEGRVVCVGDTAWAPTPLTGWGTSLALQYVPEIPRLEC